jgi:hypothetical protein
MSIVVHLPEELSERLIAAAVERGVSAEQLAVETIDAHLVTPQVVEARLSGSARRRFGFVGMGHSDQRDLSERVKEYRRADFGSKGSTEV